MHSNYIYLSPGTQEPLLMEVFDIEEGNVINGKLYNDKGISYTISNGIPDFRNNQGKQEWLEYYEQNAATYDNYNHVTFELQGFDEYKTRKEVISRLGIIKGQKILEIGCGTGRDSVIISELLQNSGELFLADISLSMLQKCKAKLESRSALTEFILADAAKLPFPDNYFDHSFSFVTLPATNDQASFLKEITRVTKPGGKVLIGTEALIPSYKEALFGKLILNNCNLYDNEIPLKNIPINTKNLKVEWILNGIIALVEFEVTEHEPKISEMIIPGKRGGNLYTRYFGKLEGITPETKQLALQAMDKSPKSRFDWLNEVIIAAAKKTLNNE